jgi:hypothetical protein
MKRRRRRIIKKKKKHADRKALHYALFSTPLLPHPS